MSSSKEGYEDFNNTNRRVKHSSFNFLHETLCRLMVIKNMEYF